jgi:ABC-2 type transport system permease protein
MKSKTFLILSNEMRTALQTKSFLLTTFGIPLVAIAVFALGSLLSARQDTVSGPDEQEPVSPELQVEGVVDLAGIIESISVDVPTGTLVELPDRESAFAALDGGTISAFYVIPANYVQSGDLIYVNPNYHPLSSGGQDWIMRQVLFANLLANDPERIARASQPMEIRIRPLVVEPDQGRQGPLRFFIPYVIMLTLYLVIMMASSLLLNSVSGEKKTRVIEILLVSVAPIQLLSAKIVGLGLLGLLQASIWFATGFGLLRLGGQSFAISPEFQPPLSIVAWGLAFFLLGYAVYASLMAALGALVPNIKEASQMVILVIWPLLIPLFLIVPLIEQSRAPLAVGLSLFPFTAPIAMMTRLAVGGVPAWQPWLAAGLLLLTAFLVIRAAAGAFRAQALLSGQPISPAGYYAALFQRR